MEKENKKYLADLRQVMKQEGVDCVIISGTDPHQSELAPAHWRCREWLTGFQSANGTNGTAVVLQDQAYCWTDNRFFLQAEMQLDGTGFKMMKEDGPDAVDLIDWVAEHVDAGKTVAVDGMTFSVAYCQRLEQELSDNNIKFRDDFEPFGRIYPDRPARPLNKLFVHDENIVGLTVDQKVDMVLNAVKDELANSVLLSSLDDIAWVTNLRTANDIAYSPIFVSFLFISPEYRVLFLDEVKITPEVKEHLDKYHIEVLPYDDILKFVAELPKEKRLLLDPKATCRAVYSHVGCTPVFGGSAVAKLKSIKTASMISHLETAMKKDGVALVKFFKWVEEEYPKGQLTEMVLARKLRELRLADPSCVDESFASIIGWNAHGAIVHYEPDDESDIPVKGQGILLVDSGGQYVYGTTDITRTIALGGSTPEQRHDFTLVLKGNIALSSARFPKGTRGAQLDILARQYLWNEGKAYYHGTGHGVGFFINCHEGPHQIRTQEIPVPLEPGMTSSNEPGLYLSGRYGIRIENVMVVLPWKTTEFDDFYHFETLTLFPIETSLIDLEIMTPSDVEWINAYHEKVQDSLSPLLSEEEKAWLSRKCAPISK